MEIKRAKLAGCQCLVNFLEKESDLQRRNTGGKKNTEASACIGGEKVIPCGFNVFVLGENDKVEGVI